MQGLPAVRWKSVALTYIGSATVLPAPAGATPPPIITAAGFANWSKRLVVFAQNVVRVTVSVGACTKSSWSTRMAVLLFDRIVFSSVTTGAGVM